MEIIRQPGCEWIFEELSRSGAGLPGRSAGVARRAARIAYMIAGGVLAALVLVHVPASAASRSVAQPNSADETVEPCDDQDSVTEAFPFVAFDTVPAANLVAAAGPAIVYIASTDPVIVTDPVSVNSSVAEAGSEDDSVTAVVAVLRRAGENTVAYTDNDSAAYSETAADAASDTASGALSTGEYIWPASGHLTSLFGPRSATVGSTNHQGIDVCGDYGQPIRAADGGEVIVSGWSESYGYVVQIRHDNDDVTLYCHCKSLLVSVGELVAQGQEIAFMGSTGVATGTHLHFELIVGGRRVNPLHYLPQDLEEWQVWR